MFMSTYIYAPRVCGGVYHALQVRGDVLPVRQQLRQGLRAQNVPEQVDYYYYYIILG